MRCVFPPPPLRGFSPCLCLFSENAQKGVLNACFFHRDYFIFSWNGSKKVISVDLNGIHARYWGLAWHSPARISHQPALPWAGKGAASSPVAPFGIKGRGLLFCIPICFNWFYCENPSRKESIEGQWQMSKVLREDVHTRHNDQIDY